MAHSDTPTSSRARNRDQDEDEEDDPPYDQDELTGSQLGDAPPGTQTQVSRRALFFIVFMYPDDVYLLDPLFFIGYTYTVMLRQDTILTFLFVKRKRKASIVCI
jgi:hypothetical protein